MSLTVRLAPLEVPCPLCGGQLYRSVIGLAEAGVPQASRFGAARCAAGCRLLDGHVPDSEVPLPGA